MILKQACVIMHSRLTVDIIIVQLQTGMCDCCLLAVAMAYDLCSGVDPFSRYYHIGCYLSDSEK